MEPFLRIARQDLVRAMAASTAGRRGPGFSLHGVGDGWLGSPHQPLSDPQPPDLTVVTDSAVHRSPTEGWVLQLAPGGIQLRNPTGAAPLPGSLALAGPGERRIALRHSQHSSEIAIPDRYSRAAGALSAAVWRRLAEAHIVLVGTSRTGAPLARMLTRTGIGTLTLLDPDRIEAHNLDAIGHPDDLGAPKAVALAAELAAMGSRTHVRPLATDVTHHVAARAVAAADVVISCVDNPQARRAVAAIAAAMLTSHLDVGTGVFAEGEERTGGADIRLLGPGEGCMVCVGGLAPSPDGGRGPFPGGRAGSDPGLNHLAAAIAFTNLSRWFSDTPGPRWTTVDNGVIGVQEVAGPRPGCTVCRARGRGWPALHQPLPEAVAREGSRS